MKSAFDKLIELTGNPRTGDNKAQRLEHLYWLGAVATASFVLYLSLTSLNAPLNDTAVRNRPASTASIAAISKTDAPRFKRRGMRAVAELQARAGSGQADAQFALANTYRMGFGVPVDLARALQWYQSAAALGHSRSQFHLGMAYRLGDGVTVNLHLARYWLHEAARQGHADAKIMLAKIAADPAPPEPVEEAIIADFSAAPLSTPSQSPVMEN